MATCHRSNRHPRVLLVALALASACGQSPPAPKPELVSALRSAAVARPVALGQPSLFRREGSGAFVFGHAEPMPAAARGIRIGQAAQLELDARKSRVKVQGALAPAALTLTPERGPAGFAGWGPGVASGGSILYAASDGTLAAVEHAHATGLKEDLVLTRSVGDAVRFEWTLELGAALDARLEEDGSVAVAAVEGAKTVHYRLPAPTVKSASGATLPARFELGERDDGERRLSLVATGLDALEYPVSVDPSITITSTADFVAGGNFEANVAAGTDAVAREKTAFAPSPWSSTGSNTFVIGRYSHGAAVLNGALYVLGGRTFSGMTAIVEYCTINADGSLNAVQSTAGLPGVRAGFGTAAFNGHLYVVGGTNGSNLADVRIATLAGSGPAISGWQLSSVGLPSPRTDLAAIASNGFLYVTGGFDGTSNLADTLVAPIHADGTLGAFVATTPLPSARRSHAVAVANGFFYVSGGYGPGGLFDVQVAPILSDGSLGAFTATSSLPGDFEDHAMAVSNGNLFVFGGTNAASGTNATWIAPLRSGGLLGPFTPGPGLTVARSDLAGVAYGGFLYAVEGSPAGAASLNSVDVAKVAGNGRVGFLSKSGVSILPSARLWHASATAGGWVYVSGGTSDGTTPLGDVSAAAIDPVTGALGPFTAIGTLPGSGRFKHAMVTHDGYLFVAGGVTTGGAVLGDLQRARIYPDGTMDPFSAVTNTFTTARAGLALVANGRSLYVLGGDTGSGSLADVQVAPIAVGGSVGVFVPTASFTTARSGLTALVVGGNLYVVGGTNGAPLSDVQLAPIALDGTLGAFTATTSLPTARAWHASATANGFLYVIAGLGGSPLADLQAAPINADGTLGAFVSQGNFNGGYGLTAVLSNGVLTTLGGSTSGVGTPNSFVVSGPVSGGGVAGTFATSSLPGPRGAHASAASTGRLYLMGGTSTGSNFFSDVISAPVNADGTLGTFTTAGSFTTGRQLAGGLALNGFLYIVAGAGASGDLADVQFAALQLDGGVGAMTATSGLPIARNGAAVAAWNQYVYVAGGYHNTARAEVYVAAQNPDGTLSTFAAATPLPAARPSASAVAHDGVLYVAGGSAGGNGADDVWAAPINPADGSLGAFTSAQPLPAGATRGALVARDGYLTFVGGVDAVAFPDVWAAPVASSGALLGWQRTTPLTTARSAHSASILNGTLFVAGGWDGTSYLSTVEGAPLLTPTSRGEYSKVLNLGQASTPVSLAVNGSATLGTVTVSYKTAPPGGAFGGPRFLGPVPLGATVLLTGAGSNVQYVLVRLSFDDTQSAAINADANTERDVLDLTLVANPDPVLTPAVVSVPPLGSQQFACDGGSGSGYAFAVTTSASGAPNVTGAGLYTAGGTGSVTDVLTCTDSASSTATAIITVTAGVSVSPSAATLPPRASQTFTPSGGSNTGFTFTLPFAGSDGGITAGGAYTAGPIGNTTDVVKVADSLGNSAIATLTIGPGASLSPASVTVPPKGSQQFGADGGSGTGYAFSLPAAPSGGAVTADGGLYTAGPTGSVTDQVQVIDSLGNVGTASVTVGPSVTLVPAAPSTPPRSTIAFGADGGSGAGYVFTLQTASSGGSVTTAGLYTAGATGGTADEVKVVDSLGNVALASVTVTAGVSLSPASASTTPRGAVTFSASGGSGTGFTWSLQTDFSGGSVDGGVYTAGPTGSGTDVVQVTDSLGNTATANVSLSAGVSLSPPSASLAPRASQTFTASGGSGAGFSFTLLSAPSGGAISSGGAYTAGATGGVTDVVQVTDSLGNVQTASITVGPGVSTTPLSATEPPRGTVTFGASGGSGAGFTWSMQAAPSGGSVDPSTGAYTAGATGSVTDVVKVTDSLGNTATANVSVSAPVSLAPAAPSVPPRGPLTLVATGGSGTGFTYSFVTNASGGSLNAVSGAYVAGTTPSVTDVVQAVDSLGNSAQLSISVGPPISLSPSTLTVAPRESATLVASGGQGTGYTFSLTTNASSGTVGSTSGVYTAGATGGVTDVVTVTDPLGNSATLSITVTAGVGLSPSSASTPPKGSQTFAASGGKGAFTYALATNTSGGSIGATSGAYTAGATGSVTDVVQATDALGNVATANVTVTAAVSLSPSSPSLPPSQSLALTASGGSGTGWAWAFVTNASGGTLDATTGAYKAGTAQGDDVVQVTDSLGNVGTLTITVTTALAISPGSANPPPRGTVVFSGSGGSGTGFVWSLAVNNTGAAFNPATATYTAGPTPTGLNPPDRVHLVDSLGNVADALLTVKPGVTVAPVALTLPPKASHTFIASGGSDTGFTFALTTNASGGTVGASSGAYTAGLDGGVTDVVTATDSLGNTGTSTISVGPGVTVSGTTGVYPLAYAVTLTATGGSGQGYSFAFGANPSGGSLTGSSGNTTSYRPGATGSVTDTVRVTDDLGNVGTLSIPVTASISITATTPPPLATGQTSLLKAAGGSNNGFQWSMLTSSSGGTVGLTSGLYTAGITGNVTDVVQVVDDHGNTATFDLQVLPSLAISPSAVDVVPSQRVAFTASGGSGAGLKWEVKPNNSQGTIGVTNGAYVAGPRGNVTDTIQVTDSLGNFALATVTIGPAVTVSPPASNGPPGVHLTFTAQGGLADGGYTWDFAPGGRVSGGAIDGDAGTYVAGSIGSVTDVVQATDALGNVGTATVTLSQSLAIAPAGTSAPPSGKVSFTASGGGGAPYVWSLAKAPSGGAIDAASGAYVAGKTGTTTDVVQVVDALGNVASVDVAVTAGVSIFPASTSVDRRGPVSFSASGGSGTGYAWSLPEAPSGGAIERTTGAYTAGPTGGVNDLVKVVDSLGNEATATVSVSSAGGGETVPVAEQPALNGWSCGCDASGGSGLGVFGLLALVLAARRPRRPGPAGARARGLPAGRTGAGLLVALALVAALPARAAGSTATALIVPVTDDASTVMDGLLEQLTKANLLAKAAGGRSKAVACLTGTGDAQRACLFEAARLSNVLSVLLVRTQAKGKLVTVTFEVLELASRTTVHTQTMKLPEGLLPQAAHKAMPKLVPALKKLKREAEALAPLPPAPPKPEPEKTPVATTTPPTPTPPPGPPPPGPTTAPPPPKVEAPRPRRSVAVFDVEVTIPNEKLDAAAFSEMLATAVDSVNVFKVISSKEIATMVGIERQKQVLGCSDDTGCMAELASALGTDFVMVASVGRVGDNYLVSVKMIDGVHSRVAARASVQAKSANGLLEAIWRAAHQTLDAYGATLPAPEAQAWAARPKPPPPATIVTADETPSHFGVTLGASGGYQPLSVAGKRGTVGGEVDLTWRRGRLDVAGGVVIAPSPGVRVMGAFALLDGRFRVDAGARATVFPGLGRYGGGPTLGVELGLTPLFALQARGTAELYPAQGTVIVALLGAVGVAARF